MDLGILEHIKWLLGIGWTKAQIYVVAPPDSAEYEVTETWVHKDGRTREVKKYGLESML